MSDIYTFKNGSKSVAKVDKMFGTHGPYMLEGKRLDQLIKVQLLHDASTSTSTQTGSSVSSAKTGNMVKRAVIGGALTGGVGAVVGGVTGKREATINTTTTTQVKAELTVELIYLDGCSQYIFLDDLKPFHWLLSFANQASMTNEEVESERLLAESVVTKQIEEDRLRVHLNARVSNLVLPPEYIKDIVNKYYAKNLFGIFGIFIGFAIILKTFYIVWLMIPIIPFYKEIMTWVLKQGKISDSDLEKQYLKAKQDIVNQAISLKIVDLTMLPVKFEANKKYNLQNNNLIKITK